MRISYTWHLVALVGLVSCLGGCATSAQRQAAAMNAGASAAIAELTACAQSAYDNPAFAELRVRAPLNLSQASLIQMTDTSKVTPSEVLLLSERHAMVVPCRQHAFEQLSSSFPKAVPILIELAAAADQRLLDLAQRKITWGEYVSKGKRILEEAQVRLVVARQQTIERLDAAHQQEMINRQAALNAMSKSLATTAQYYQNQQVINNMNRSVMTNCTTVGNTVNCISR